MTPDEQRIAIAQWHGFKVVPAEKPAPDWPDSMWNIIHGDKRVDSFGWWNAKLKQVPSIPTLENCIQSLPDFLNDLNAIHEAVMLLKERDSKAYLRYQQNLIALDGLLYPDATAAQRSEALLRTLNLWTDEGGLK